MEIVFVHLGRNIPGHLVENFLSFKGRFPKLEVKLIISDDCKVPKRLNSNHLYFDNSAKRDHLFIDFDHDLNFRNQFWRRSIERIMAVCEYQIKNLNTAVLHFESDILILPNFPFHMFEQISSIAWQNYNEDRDVASILYIPNIEASAWLYKQISEQISRDKTVTDMSALRAIRRAHPTVCHVVPNLPAGNIFADNPKHSSLSTQPVNYIQTNGVFDSAQIGMWLLGMDPRNTYGVLRLHNRGILDSGEAPVDPSRIGYSMDNIGALNAVFEDGKTYPIFSLHVHSKELQLFKLDYYRPLRNYVKLANAEKSPISRFSTGVLLKMFITSVISGNVFNFFLGIPLIYRLRLRIRTIRDHF